MKEEITELGQDEKVDIYNLHTEYQKQAALYGKWGRRKAKAVKEDFELKEQLKVIKAQGKRKVDEKKAELDILFRTNYNQPKFYRQQHRKYDEKCPEYTEILNNFQLSCQNKITEAMVSSFVTLHPEYIQIQKEVDEEANEIVKEIAEKTEQLGLLDTAIMAMVHRKAAIEGEISLWLGEYYSDPKVPKPYIEQEEKKVQKKLRKRLKKGD